MKKELTPEVEAIIQKMLAKLKATPFDGRTKATLQMLDDADLMAGHRAEIESFFEAALLLAIDFVLFLQQ